MRDDHVMIRLIDEEVIVTFTFITKGNIFG